ncbi:MAG: zinc-finger domain-containing protein [Burkholderiales bacterium]|nr:zinc-finger domain-containing protein [Burkholderiales bacterium]
MSEQANVIEVTAAELQGPGVVFCPNPKMALWSSHPKVYVDLSHNGEGKCPYCGTLYRLRAGERIAQGH